MFNNWRARALAAEAQLAAPNPRAVLVDISAQGRRTVRLTLMRNDAVTHIEFMSTWDDDVEGWKRALL